MGIYTDVAVESKQRSTHQTVGNVLHTLLHVRAPYNVQQTNDLVDTALATAPHALRSSVHRTLHMFPGALVFRELCH